ncbi:MAG: ATP-binding protein [Clostridiales bacterium]|nr:ATP-binding protein [Clostridiales bacterium]
MKKHFNTTGLCIPHYHYMADVSGKIHQIIQDYINREEYFTINRARQSGKTTILYLLQEALKSDYVVISISFEGKEEYFSSLHNFAEGLNLSFHKVLKKESPALATIFSKPLRETLAMEAIGDRITQLCEHAGKKVILIIDEVDKAADYTVFLSFLGLLRDRYLKRRIGGDATFSSVILAGVHDIKNLKMKIRPEDGHNYNSPWNISSSFLVDLSLSVSEITGMLTEYEQDQRTGMNIPQMALALYECTEGYPFLVSSLCKKMDETPMSWDKIGLRNAVKELLKEDNTLFDDVIKNIRKHPDFADLLEQIVIQGAQVTFETKNPTIQLGVMYGILKERNGKTIVSNTIFETLIVNYFVSIRSTSQLTSSDYVDQNLYVHGGILDMEQVLRRFSAFMKAEYRDEDGTFIERHGRLLFLSFLRPIINGTGHYAVEPQTRKNTRMDIQVFFGNQEFIVELKVWSGKKREEEGYDQLTAYLDARSVKKGYLLSFCDNQKTPHEDRTFQHNGHEICEVIVAYRDK